MLRVNDEFTKKQVEFAKPCAAPTKITTFSNNSQDGRNYLNSTNAHGILGTPNERRGQ
jgi:hypothetical protein